MTAHEAPEYLAVGHIAVDLLPDGTPILGGTALYSALDRGALWATHRGLTRGNFTKHGDAIATR